MWTLGDFLDGKTCHFFPLESFNTVKFLDSLNFSISPSSLLQRTLRNFSLILELHVENNILEVIMYIFCPYYGIIYR